MKEKDIHELIEQQDPKAKQRIWEKILNRLQLEDEYNDDSNPKDENERNSGSKDI